MADPNKISPSTPAFEHAMYYETGDYSRAALAAMEEMEREGIVYLL